MAIKSKKNKGNLPVYDSNGLVTYGRWVNRSKGKFARKVRRQNK